MTALALATQPAYPLGKPADRNRYGMTAEQAYVYGWLVKNKPHDRPFKINFRDLAARMMTHAGNSHARVAALVERGWIARDDAGYRFVQPVMRFREPRG